MRTTGGNLLWDCFGFIDEEGVAGVRERGGVAAIAISHPHFYGVMVEWSRAFGGCPIYIPAADRGWVQRDDPAIVEWSGTREVGPNLIPLPAAEIRRIVASVRPYAFDRLYGGWWDRITMHDGKATIERSAERYLRWIGAADGSRSAPQRR